MRATPESPRMFEQDWLDALSRTPWWTVPLVWIPLSAASLGYGLWTTASPPLAVGAGLFVAGWLMWTFMEYILHRTFFHWIPNDTWGARMHFLVHGVHHDWHQDPYRLVMPPAVSLLLGVLFFGLFTAMFGALGHPDFFWTFYSGFLLGYTFYDVSHYAIHHLKWKNGAFQRLKKHHLLHHHSPRHKDRKYGVSTTLWDHVFRTY